MGICYRDYIENKNVNSNGNSKGDRTANIKASKPKRGNAQPNSCTQELVIG